VGLGFVLVFWALLGGIGAVVCALALGAWSWWNHRRAPGCIRILHPLAAAALPFLLLAYAGAAFTGYAVWCAAIRDVDPGIGDGWQVPLGHDLFFCMIDVPDEGFLLKGGCSGSAIVAEITELGGSDDVLVGSSRSSGPFVLDMRTGKLQAFSNIDAALSNVTPRPSLQSADDFYRARRWGLADAIAAVLIVIPAIVASLLWYLWFVRRPMPQRDLPSDCRASPGAM
jgi:hypothetical protein